MTETVKTTIFVFLAVVLVAAAYFCRPVVTEFKSEEMVGKQLFPQFTDPLAVKTLEIVKLDAAGEKADFKIAEVEGVWSIPSHDNYPADAKDQMAKCAEALTNLTVLDVVSAEDKADLQTLQETYGVVAPDTENVREGTGIKITLGGADNKKLVDLIIGKTTAQKKDAGPMQRSETELRYVRVAGQQPIYVIAIDPSRFPTDFDRWIEKNLLDISTLDIKQIYIEDSSFKTEVSLGQDGLQQVLEPSFNGDITLGYNAGETGAAKWKLSKWMEFKGQDFTYQERRPDPNKELNSEALDTAVSSLNDLKIVSVLRKPKELAAALRDGKSFEQIKMDESMKKTGFYLVPMPDLRGDRTKSVLSLLSNEGNIQLQMKDGIRYTLRFGGLTGTESEINKGDEEGGDRKEENPTMGANRYLFITADFDASVITPPEIKEVPESPKDAGKEDVEKLTKENEEIEKANKREEERYASAVEDGKKRAEKLSVRFADWYYVIPEDVYKKIHLTEANVFKNAHSSPEDVEIRNSEPAQKPNPADKLPDLPGVE
ncbi:hypothetical protein FACS189419_07840 [Planctomycetales bacterium]|nr:hypothetical protein FACS189419_07840 [Planctomycetales bacterium]